MVLFYYLVFSKLGSVDISFLDPFILFFLGFFFLLCHLFIAVLDYLTMACLDWTNGVYGWESFFSGGVRVEWLVYFMCLS